ncbi:MAG: hypothetical protein EZS28_002409 [Streblomastix strix]|uniref:Uncharacterized protein n=1 Tax=Streblomastix strix TaxID=222440 RepID=A0A5J4X4A0_9EUKA|nr:MAG: hypothetical protein EZS28_002409 [Streblomastix strix]
MIRGVERNQLLLSKSKKQVKELTDPNNQQRLQYVDNLIAAALPPTQSKIESAMLPKLVSKVIENELNYSLERQQSCQPEHQSSQSQRQFNKNKYTDADRTTAQVTPQEVIDKLAQPIIQISIQPIVQLIIQPLAQNIIMGNHLNAYISHPNLEVMKFVVDCIWRTVTHRNKGDDFILSLDNFIKFWSIVTQEKEDDIEIVLDESIIAAHSCLSKQYKKKEIVRVIDVQIKNVSINTQDNVLWNSVEKLYRINKDLVRLSEVPAIYIDPTEF